MQGKIIPWSVPKRYVIVIMVFIGYLHYFYVHTNIGMVVVEMTSIKNFLHENGTILRKPEYDWSSQQKGLVLSSFAYGRLFSPIGGAIAGRLGGGTLYGIGILGNALMTLLTPFLLSVDFYFFVIATALTGTFESFSYVSVAQLWSRWTPPDERAKCISITIVGAYVGSIASFLIAGQILSKWGWKTLFYTTGAASSAFYCLWILLIKNDPSEDQHVSEEERKYIQDKLNNADQINKKLVYPWKDILTCAPFWAGCCSKLCTGCGYTFTMLQLPQYIKDISNIDIEQIGYISLIPQICSVISMPLAGYLSDYLRQNKKLSLTNVHKLYISTGLFIGGITFLVIGVWSNFTACIIFLCLFQISSTFVTLDLHILVLDLAPRYAAFMHSFTYFFYTAACFSTPIFVGFYVTSHSQMQWSVCFLILSSIFTIIGLLFLKLGSGELQPWADYAIDKH